MVKSVLASKRVLRPPEVRGANRAAILGLLQQNDYMSRADVARQSGLSEGAISRIVTGLLDDRLVREDGAENSTGGRPGRRLALERSRVIFGVEIQNWETRCALSTMNGHLVESTCFRTHASAEETLDQVVQEFLAFRKRLGPDRLPGIGICIRGIVNSDKGVLVLGGRPDWRKIPIRSILESRLHEPVYVENNVRAAALAEYTYGPSEMRGSQCFVFVKIDEGVGMGVLFDGRLYHGPHMAAGEFGQMVIETSTTDERHDRGIGISNLIWGLDADTVVIDATLGDAWSLIEPIVRRQLPDDHDLWGLRNLLVRSSALGGEAALVGAATLPLSKIFAGASPA